MPITNFRHPLRIKLYQWRFSAPFRIQVKSKVSLAESIMSFVENPNVPLELEVEKELEARQKLETKVHQELKQQTQKELEIKQQELEAKQKELETLQQELETQPTSKTSSKTEVKQTFPEELIKKIGNEYFTMTKNVESLSNQEEKRETRSLKRSLRKIKEGFDGSQIELLNHTGQPFHSGLSLKVLSFEYRPEHANNTIVETIRPSIFVLGSLIQQGEVIVGTTERKEQ